MADGNGSRRRAVPSLCLGALAAALSVAGCTRINVRDTAIAPGTARPTTIAVAPLDDLSGNPSASAAVTSAIVNELRRTTSFQVVELAPGQSGATERWTAARLGKDASAGAVLVGVVTAFTYDRFSRRGGSTLTPSIGVDLRLVGVEDADVLWAAGVEAGMLQVFSDDGMPLEQLAQELAERVADALAGLGAR